jgi:hypothetical protein
VRVGRGAPVRVMIVRRVADALRTTVIFSRRFIGSVSRHRADHRLHRLHPPSIRVPLDSGVMSSSFSSVALVTLVSVLVACSLPSASAWKPRAGPRSPNFANRHRFFLPNPCVLHDEHTGAEFDITSLRKTGSAACKLNA